MYKINCIAALTRPNDTCMKKVWQCFGIELLIASQNTCTAVVWSSILTNTQHSTCTVQKAIQSFGPKSLAQVVNNTITLFRCHIFSYKLSDRLEIVH